MAGTLFVVATPIGNLEDMSLRAIRVLKEAALVACEDTRVARKLLDHYEIATPVISYHAHSGPEIVERIAARLAGGEDVALISDAGTPLLSDPGQSLVVAAIERGAAVVPIPGASAVSVSPIRWGDS
jgi:16S rRNA (cytidine1402-2'-O)-methyltransferase